MNTDQEASQRKLLNVAIAIGIALYVCTALILIGQAWGSPPYQDKAKHVELPILTSAQQPTNDDRQSDGFVVRPVAIGRVSPTIAEPPAK